MIVHAKAINLHCRHTHTHTLSIGNKNQQIANADTNAPGGTVGEPKCWRSDKQASETAMVLHTEHTHTHTHIHTQTCSSDCRMLNLTV